MLNATSCGSVPSRRQDKNTPLLTFTATTPRSNHSIYLPVGLPEEELEEDEEELLDDELLEDELLEEDDEVLLDDEEEELLEPTCPEELD